MEFEFPKNASRVSLSNSQILQTTEQSPELKGIKSGDIGRKKMVKNNRARAADKYQPNLELCVDNVTEVEINQED